MLFVLTSGSIQETTTSPAVSLCSRTVTVPKSIDRYALLEAMYQGAPYVLALLAIDGTVVDANPAGVAFMGASLEELRGQLCWETPGWRAAPALAAWLRYAIERNGGADIERYRHVVAATDTTPGVVREFAVRRAAAGANGGVVFRVSGEDVTERTRAEREFAERTRRLEMLYSHMHEMLFLVRVEAGPSFRCESVNAAYLAATGLREDEVLEKPIDAILSSARAAVARQHYLDAMASPTPITVREHSDTPARRLVETTLTCVRDAAGTVTHIMGLARDVTDTVRAVEALRESEARFRAALDAGHDAFVIARAERDETGTIVDFRIVDANARAAGIVNSTVPSLVGQPLLTAFPLSRETGLWEQCCRVVATRRPYEMAQAAPSPTLPGRWVQRQIVPLGDGVAISSRDVTTRRREQEALEASEARHRQLFESSGAIQLIVDESSGAIVDVNPAAEAFYGWSRVTMRAMLITDLDATSVDAWRAYGERTASITPVKPETRVHRVASGSQRDVEFASSPVVIDGRLARHLIVHDVSDRVRAERALRESEARFRAVINEMSEGVMVHDATGAMRIFNPSAERILGLTGDELRGLQPISHDWRAVHEDGSPWPVADHPAMRALRTGESQRRTIMGIVRGDREHVWLHVTADPLIRAGETTPYASVAVFSDITAQRVAEERLRQAQKLEAIGQLAGGIAHDFNNLLTVIRGAAGFLREALAAEPTSLDDLAAIDRATDRAEELTRRLLAIGRRQLLLAEPVDLSALVRAQADTLRRVLPRTIDVRVTAPADAVTARLDREQLLHALRILVENAQHAMNDHGTLTIGTSVRHVDRAVTGGRGSLLPFAVLEVSDTGEGMSDAVRSRIFEPFFSTEPFGTSRGIDLASVHGMVVQSQGFMECDSAPGAGTTFRLYFPLSLQPERAATPAAGTRTIETRSVLMVDDDPMLRELGRRMLERLGHSVTTAASGEEALDLLNSSARNVSVVVTDLTMPAMGGLELIARIEQLYPSLPIVAISGFTMNPTVREELDAHQIPFVGKPFTSDELAKAIERANSARRDISRRD